MEWWKKGEKNRQNNKRGGGVYWGPESSQMTRNENVSLKVSLDFNSLIGCKFLAFKKSQMMGERVNC